MDDILDASQSLIRLHTSTESAFFDGVWKAQNASQGAGVIRIIRGWKCPTMVDFLSECAAAWQFPHYFKDNLDGFVDCLGDLSWWPAEHYVLAVCRASKLLDGVPATGLKQFSELMSAVQDRHVNPGKRTKPRQFHVVFQTTTEAEPLLQTRLKSAKLALNPNGRKK